MPNAKILNEKKAVVEQLTETLKSASSGVLVDYKGITVAEDTALRQELLDYMAETGIYRGPVFISRTGQVWNRSNIFRRMQELCLRAGVPEEKANPRCLRNLYKATQQTLDHGKRLLELLKQPLYQPMSVSRQAVLLYIATQGLLDDVPLEQIRSLINGFMEELETRYSDVLAEVQKTGDLGGVAIETVRAALAEYKSRAAAAQ